VSAVERNDPNWSRRALVAAFLVGFVLLTLLIGAATIPRWWAQQVGGQVDGSITTGVLVGLFYGFVFTALPLLVLALVLRLRRTWRWIAFGVAVALVLAIPNLMTLGIVLGTGNAAHAGERILDVEAPAFRGASLAGALLAAAMAVFVGYLLLTRRQGPAPTRGP
jgi:hypothetical protein